MEDDYKRKIILRVDADDLPEIKGWEVGKKYELEVKVKMIAKSEGDPYSIGPEDKKKKPKVEATFEVIEVEPQDDEEDEDMKGLDSDTKKKVKEIGEKRYG